MVIEGLCRASMPLQENFFSVRLVKHDGDVTVPAAGLVNVVIG
jgi:hypothetical protein